MKTVIILFLFIQPGAFAQNQQRTLFIYNVAFGGVTSGIGSVINKPKDVNWKKAFVKGLWQGSIGGLLDYSGKKTLYLINENQNSVYAWPAKILHAAGYSIMENAALNEPFLQNWHIDYGPVRFDFSFNKKRSFKARLLPESVFATIMAGVNGKFDLLTSLTTGEIIFKSNRVLDLPNTQPAEGVTFGRAIIYVENAQSFYTKERILSHELVHRFQYNEYQIFNTWLKPAGDKIKSKSLRTIFQNMYILISLMPSFHTILTGNTTITFFTEIFMNLRQKGSQQINMCNGNIITNVYIRFISVYRVFHAYLFTRSPG